MRREVISRAAGYLLRRQAADGHWEDFRDLPQGASDQWVTAYVALALVAAARAGAHAGARAAAERAADWLLAKRPYAAGWGYHRRTGPDTDSTANVLRLMAELHRPVRDADVAFLLGKRRAGGGFTTYQRADAWGQSHPCVTPVAYLALPREVRASLRGEVCEYIVHNRFADGTWPAYWWKTHHYSTYWNLAALAEAGKPSPPPAALSGESAFELALASAIASLGGQATRLVDELALLQRSDGSFAPSYNLRVTDPSCYRPWEKSIGRVYCDAEGLFTTATVMLA